MSLKFCANLSFMYQESKVLLERYHLAKNSGFKGVECAQPYEHDLKELKDVKNQLNLEQILINVPNGDLKKGEMGFASLPGKEEEFLSSLKKSIEYALALNCQLIHITAGIVEKKTELHDTTYINNLKRAVPLLEKNNLIGVIEPINKYSLPNYYMNDFSTGIKVIESINSPYLKLQMDIFHLQTMEGNLTRNIDKYFPLIGHIQIAQVPDRNEPDTPGEIDYKYIFKLLTQLEYKGWIGLEYKPSSGLDWIQNFGYCL